MQFNHGIVKGLILVLVSALSTNISSEIYRWVDETGKVHYGDEKPEDVAGDRIEVEQRAEFGGIAAEPIAKPTGIDTAVVYISNPKMPWEETPSQPYSLGNYYFGSSCNLVPTALNWPTQVKGHERLIAQPERLASGVRRVLQDLNYPSRLATNLRSLERLSAQGDLLLGAEVLDLKFDVCSQVGQEQVLKGQFESLGSSHYRRHRAEVSVRWKLLDSDQATVLYEIEASGRASHWDADGSAVQTLVNAVANSFQVALSDVDFAAQLGKEKQTKRRPEPIENVESASIWDKLMPWKKHTTAARFSLVLSEMSRLKISVAEYYMMEGDWPQGLDEIGFRENDIAATTDGLDQINISSGAIEAILSDDFGESRFISLIPEFVSGAGKIVWHCESNLQSSVVPQGMNCRFY